MAKETFEKTRGMAVHGWRILGYVCRCCNAYVRTMGRRQKGVWSFFYNSIGLRQALSFLVMVWGVTKKENIMNQAKKTDRIF